MDTEQKIRAVALEAASRLIAENITKLVDPARREGCKTYLDVTRKTTIELAKDFERYIREGAA